MSNFPNIGQNFIEGASLAEKIAGRKRQQDIEQQNADTSEQSRADMADVANRNADTAGQNADTASMGEDSRAAAEDVRSEDLEATRTARIADMFSQGRQRDALAAHQEALANPPTGTLDKWSEKNLTTQYGALLKNKQYGPLEPEDQASYRAIGAELNKRHGITMPPPEAAAPGWGARAWSTAKDIGSAALNPVQRIASSLSGPAAPPTAAPAAGPASPAPSGGMIRVKNKKTGATGSIPKGNYNPDTYEQLGQ